MTLSAAKESIKNAIPPSYQQQDVDYWIMSTGCSFSDDGMSGEVFLSEFTIRYRDYTPLVICHIENTHPTELELIKIIL
ncbi:hypothetical protein [Photobacterium phosphoreum]|uniref:hypothetical protein n=1 Tax=Photobacterium phosphoreum TaxID=659 RepID=UPI001E4A387D|nr:hypothetical protein [Photobacterium phosphoreum]MCD9512760.1 hypothetical protein [Photobacterium phosphoreum]